MSAPAKAYLHVDLWRKRLGLGDWWIGISDAPPDEGDERASSDIDRNLHRAVLRFDPTLPMDQLERSVLHEMLHVRLAELEDVFRIVVGVDAGDVRDPTAATWWHRADERVIEALVDAFLPDQPRRDYRGGIAWVTGR